MATNLATVATNIGVVVPNITGLDVVGQVNALYSSAFDKLFQLVLWMLGFVGVVLPILIPLYQKRIMRSELKEQMEGLLITTEGRLREQIAENFSEEKKAIEKRLSKAEGNAFHLQGQRNFDKGNFRQACADFCKAAELYCKAESGHVLTRTIKLIADKILPHIKKDELEQGGLSGRLDELLKEVGKINKDGFLNDLLRDFAAAHREAKQRN